MELIPEWAPNFHPMVVHFPLALLSVALLFDLLTFFLPERAKRWGRSTTLSLYVVGALSAIGVYFTGQAAADSVFMPASAQSVLNSHADWALLTIWFYCIYTILRLAAVWLLRAHRTKVHVVFFILSMAGVFMLYKTGEHGAQMVFQHGVGVQASEGVEEDPATPETEGELATAFEVRENGDWSWNIQEGALQTLEENFQFLKGSSESIQATASEDDESYRIRFSSEDLNQFFVTHVTYQNVQVDYYLDLSEFEGTVTLINHLQDTSNYDYVSITGGGTVEQARVSGGETEVFETGSADVSNPVFVRTVANGTHFRGYVDKEMIVHGHGDAPDAGSVGLKLDGNGTLLLERMELTQLSEE